MVEEKKNNIFGIDTVGSYVVALFIFVLVTVCLCGIYFKRKRYERNELKKIKNMLKSNEQIIEAPDANVGL